MAGAKQRVHVRVSGRVQGVGYRYFTARHAESLGLQGWVRNQPNGDVELEAQGPDAAVKDLLAALRVGPPLARVTGLTVSAREPIPMAAEFEFRY